MTSISTVSSSSSSTTNSVSSTRVVPSTRRTADYALISHPADPCSSSHIATEVTVGIFTIGIFPLVRAIKAVPNTLFRYALDADFGEAYQYLNRKEGNGELEAFVTRRGWNVIHLIFETDVQKEREAQILLDKILEEEGSKQKFKEMNPFTYTFSREKYSHFRHLVRNHLDCLRDEDCLSLFPLFVERERIEEAESVMSLCQSKKRASLLSKGGQYSPYVTSARMQDLRLFHLFSKTVSRVKASLEKDVCHMLLHLYVKAKVSKDVAERVIAHLQETNRTNIISEGEEDSPIATSIKTDQSLPFGLFVDVIDSSRVPLPHRKNLLHLIAENNADRCFGEWHAKKPKELLPLLNAQNDEQQTALFVAAHNNYDLIVDRCIRLGGDFSTPSNALRPFEVANNCCLFSRRTRNLLWWSEHGFFNKDTISNCGEIVIKQRRENGLLLCCLEGVVSQAIALVSDKVNPNSNCNGNLPLPLLLKSEASEEDISIFYRYVAQQISRKQKEEALLLAKKKGFKNLSKLLAAPLLEGSSARSMECKGEHKS